MQYHRIPVHDIHRSARFYGALLGTEATIHPKGDYAEVEAEGVLLALFGPDFESYDRRTPELDRPLVRIDLPPLSQAHVQQVLREHGLLDPDSPIAHDPDGHLIAWTPTDEVQIPHAR